ncbi:MAG: DUF1566 domain-containing protein [Methylococcales bacterium]|nr:DUF1566 domain-containing protein [Methylococcales bacterium]
MFFLVLPVVGNAQTCNISSIVATTPTSQFTDNSNGTVTDNKTGLIWKRCSEGQNWDGATFSCAGITTPYTWQAALMQVQANNGATGFSGQVGWRVPNSKELSSIVEERCFSPAINLTIFPNTPESTVFWSSSPHTYNGSVAWSVDFNYGSDGAGYKPSFFNRVRLVRSGQ